MADMSTCWDSKLKWLGSWKWTSTSKVEAEVASRSARSDGLQIELIS